MSVGLFPGSFDPLTLGHVDIVKKALTVFDRVIVLVADDPFKKYTFSGEERMRICREDLEQLGSVEVVRGAGLTAQFAEQHGCCALIRGMRAESDFSSEYRMAQLNQQIGHGLQTVFFLTSPQFSYLSSAVVKNLYISGADVSDMVPENAYRAMQSKLKKTSL